MKKTTYPQKTGSAFTPIPHSYPLPPKPGRSYYSRLHLNPKPKGGIGANLTRKHL